SKQIQAPGVDIEVEPLPQRPIGFSGGVGRLSMNAEIDKTELKSNDPLTVKVTISGVGNLQLIKEPTIKFPLDFDTYDPKRTDRTKLTANGLEGNVVFEYLAVPRHAGQFDIPPVEFIYYDTQAKTYKTLTSEAFHLDVAKGEGGENAIHNYGQEDVETLAKDIRHIRLGNVHQHRHDDIFFGSSEYWIAFAALLVGFISLFLIFRRRAVENADVVKSRGKKANKVATKRLKQAAKLMRDNKPSQFYDEALRALWGYVGDKLNIPVEQLSRENISERLQERHVEATTIEEFIGAIDECEFERYAPGDPKGNMSRVYEKAMTAIEKIEGNMKRKPKKNTVMVLLLLLLLPVSAGAVTKADADSAYVNEDYRKAIEIYEALLQDGVSPELYYNLGNAYYRVDDNTHAILNYERALLLAPGDADIKFNLQMAQSRTVDKIVPESEMFFVTWYHSLVNLTDVDGWAYLALGSLALAIILALLYLFSGSVLLRKVGFFGGIVAVVAFLL
ncbi:MAG: BatD family protein, partial [Prevotella sp.]|nr:BatD family protein [Prevotella sp.]